MLWKSLCYEPTSTPCILLPIRLIHHSSTVGVTMGFLNLFQSTSSTFEAAAVLLGVLILYRLAKVSRERLSHIQVHSFGDGNDSAQRYVKDTKVLLHEGYEKVCQ